ncbi:hypothetical protein MD484_g6470, partial [Candolleomyces efflorescens]
MPAAEFHVPGPITGQKLLINSGLNDRVADLVNGGEGVLYLAGWRRNPERDQVLDFEALPEGGNRISVIDRNGTVFHVSSPDPAAGSRLQATPLEGGGSVYTVVAHAPGQVKLSILSADGAMSLLYWTLHDGDEGAVIYLALDTGESNQIWAVVSPDAD